MTDPTTGGVTASWAMLGDILIAEPKATIGFAGRRVIQDTVRETFLRSFKQLSTFKDHGFIDLVVREKIFKLLSRNSFKCIVKKAEIQAKNQSSDVVTIDKSIQSAS